MESPVPRWTPSTTVSGREQTMLKRTEKRRRLFAMLRERRLELFDDAFQDELAGMYRDTGEGKEPVPPALLAMALLLQAYMGVSDADAVDLTVVDARWQMVLDVTGADEPAFSQGTLQAFRERLIRNDMDQRLLERTVELAKKTGVFDWKKLPKSLRIAIDSRPLVGAGRVEDTINLLGHAAFKLLGAAALFLERKVDAIARGAGAPAFLHSSIKRGLDIDWGDPEQKAKAVAKLVTQIEALERWIRTHVGEAANEPPMKELLDTIAQIREQNLELDPKTGAPCIRDGVAPDRRISIEDDEMRHGRKSATKCFNGYKEHVAHDLDTDLVVACAVFPANCPEQDAVAPLRDDIAHYPDRNTINEMHIDRAYLGSPVVGQLAASGGEVVGKPWTARNGALFPKTEFPINLRTHTITCPAGQTQKFRLGQVVKFDPATCTPCPLRAQCTKARHGAGRTVHIAKDEPLQKRLRKQIASRTGRRRARERVAVEHKLAHLAAKQGRKARYRGTRKNLYDTRRHAAVLNLEVIDRREREIRMAA